MEGGVVVDLSVRTGIKALVLQEICEIALDIVRSTKEQYYEMFRELKETIEKDWL